MTSVTSRAAIIDEEQHTSYLYNIEADPRSELAIVGSSSHR